MPTPRASQTARVNELDYSSRQIYPEILYVDLLSAGLRVTPRYGSESPSITRSISRR